MQKLKRKYFATMVRRCTASCISFCKENSRCTGLIFTDLFEEAMKAKDWRGLAYAVLAAQLPGRKMRGRSLMKAAFTGVFLVFSTCGKD